VFRKTLRNALERRERREGRLILRSLRVRERDCFTRVRQLLVKLRYPA
jgi:hypothetical protein